MSSHLAEWIFWVCSKANVSSDGDVEPPNKLSRVDEQQKMVVLVAQFVIFLEFGAYCTCHGVSETTTIREIKKMGKQHGAIVKRCLVSGRGYEIPAPIWVLLFLATLELIINRWYIAKKYDRMVAWATGSLTMAADEFR